MRWKLGEGSTFEGWQGLQWSHRVDAVEACELVLIVAAHTTLRFNGATALMRWKLPNTIFSQKNYFWLQWSHRVDAVEA